MRKIILVITGLVLSQFSIAVFAQDPVWELYRSADDGGKFYWDTKNSYYKNGKVIVWFLITNGSPQTFPALDDFQGFTYDKSIGKTIYPCDNTQNWYASYGATFYYMNNVVFNQGASSIGPKIPFMPGDPQDKHRNFLCSKLKPFWKLS